jgi:nucleoside phosphorylase
MSNIYVFTALKAEAEAILELRETKGAGQRYVPDQSFHFGVNELQVVVSGMGPKKAIATTTEVLRPWLQNGGSSALVSGPKPDFVLVTGLCGGLTKFEREYELVNYANCLSDRDKNGLACNEPLIETLSTTLSSHRIRCRIVDGITSPRVATNRADREALARSGANVVDMESYEILALAALARIPAAVLRVVSDSCDREIPDLNKAIDTEGNFDGRKALRIALGSPVRTLRLIAANKRALDVLRPALRVVLGTHWTPGD